MIVSTHESERIAFTPADDRGWSELAVVPDVVAPEVGGEVLARIVHVSHTHNCDAESTARLEYIDRLSDPDSIYRLRFGEVGTYRPQEILTVQVLAALVEAINAHADDLDAVVVTGDLIDNAQANEKSWCAQVLDGGSIEPWSGDPLVSQWVGSREGHPWDERYWHPDGPRGATSPDIPTAQFGYPLIPGLVEAARRTVVSPGLNVPWLGVPGNHDALLQGTVAADAELRDLAVGDRRIVGLPPGRSPLLTLEGVAPIGPARYVHEADSPSIPAAPDPRRRLLSEDELSRPWIHDVGQVRFIAMDTVNHNGGWQGSLGSSQLQWLRQVLAESEGHYVVMLSHHPSWCLTNAHSHGEPRHLAAEVVHLLLDHPCVVAWLSGHVHAHASLWHGDDASGFWEITTASLIDWPQQARQLEIVRADGRIGFRSTVLDHAAPVGWSADDLSDHRALASISRVLAANDYHDREGGIPRWREGRPDDRNTVWWTPDPYA
ncbi:MAG: metallophosphoesterase [Actinomycetota bacterium]